MTRRNGQRGEESEMETALDLIKNGCRISYTHGHSHPYDLIADDDGDLLKIQVKTAKHLDRRKYDIDLSNSDKYTSENVDLFAGFAREEGEVFYVPYDEVENGRASVTFTPLAKMGSKDNRDRANHAADYTFEEARSRL